MEDFKWVQKENYTNEDITKILEQHKNVVYKQVKNEYEPKIKEYETKVNEYQEKELFTGFNEKQIKIAKSLMTSEYKDFSKSDALNKIKTDYQEIFNPKDLVKMHELADKNNINNIREKAKINGLTDKKELTELIRANFEEIK